MRDIYIMLFWLSITNKPQAPEQPKEDLPPWVRAEKQRELQAKQGGGIPWPLLLIMSGIIAIASVSSVLLACKHGHLPNESHRCMM